MSVCFRRGFVVVATLLAIASPLSAQDPPADPFAKVRNAAAVSTEDRNRVRQWVDQRVAAIVGNERMASQEAIKEFRDNARGSDAFLEALTDATVAAVGSAYKNAKRVAAVRLIVALNVLNRAATQEVLIEALRDKRPSVRAAAAVGLRGLRAQLALAGGNFVTKTLSALSEAGKRESSGATLKEIYLAMNFPAAVPSPPDPAGNVAAVLGLLEARAAQYETGKVRAVGADHTGLQLAGALRASMNEADRRRLTIVLGKMLKHAVERYAGELHKVRDKTSSPAQIAIRNGYELLIVEGERRLGELFTRQTPAGVVTQMRQAHPTEMKIDWAEWAKLLQKEVGIDFDLHDEEDEDEGDGG